MQNLLKQKKIKKDKRGSMAIEIVIGMLAFLYVLCFMNDLLVLSWKFSAISQINTKIARQAGVQGGFLTRPPTAYPGGNNSYTTIGELKTMVTDHLSKAGIKEDEWVLKIDGRQVLGGGSMAPTSEIEYRETFETELIITYEWKAINGIVPGNLSNSLTSKRPGMSEWKYKYNDWIGE